MKQTVHWVFWLRIWKDNDGQDLIEYALIAGFITTAAVALMPGIGESVSAIFSGIGVRLGSAAGKV